MLYNFEHQVLIGTILGGSSLSKHSRGKNYFISMRDKNNLWLAYKMQEMSSFFKNNSIYKCKNYYKCKSSCSNNLTELYHRLYFNGKRFIDMQILDSLKDTALAIWFIDGGGKTGRSRKNVYLNTTKFGENGTKIIHQYFNELDMKCNIVTNNNRIKILFSVKGSERFLKIVAHRFPVFMYHKL